MTQYPDTIGSDTSRRRRLRRRVETTTVGALTVGALAFGGFAMPAAAQEPAPAPVPAANAPVSPEQAAQNVVDAYNHYADVANRLDPTVLYGGLAGGAAGALGIGALVSGAGSAALGSMALGGSLAATGSSAIGSIKAANLIPEAVWEYVVKPLLNVFGGPSPESQALRILVELGIFGGAGTASAVIPAGSTAGAVASVPAAVVASVAAGQQSGVPEVRDAANDVVAKVGTLQASLTGGQTP